MCNDKLNWYIKSSTWLCVLSSWNLVSREMAHPRSPCHPRLHSLALSSVPQPPLEKARGGRRGRRTLPHLHRRRLRRHRAHGSRRRALPVRRARRRRQRRGMPPRRGREGDPVRCRLHRRRGRSCCAHEFRRRAWRLRRRWVRRRRGVRRGLQHRRPHTWSELHHLRCIRGRGG